MASVAELLGEGVARLRDSGSESPRLDAELILAYAIGVDRTAIAAHPEAPVGDGAAGRFRADIARRATGEPVAYIRGFKEFHGLALAVDPRALIPRPETERLVELALAEILRRLTETPRPAGTPPLQVADIGTGCGTIAISLAAELRRRGAGQDVAFYATDLSEDALQLARENAVGHGVADRLRFATADILPPVIPDPFDMILANLPYVPSDVVPRLPIAASFEPVQALDGGPDGLEVIERLLERLPEVLAPDGMALLEIGADQGVAIVVLAARLLAGWTCMVEQDLAGKPRVAVVSRSGAAGRSPTVRR